MAACVLSFIVCFILEITMHAIDLSGGGGGVEELHIMSLVWISNTVIVCFEE